MTATKFEEYGVGPFLLHIGVLAIGLISAFLLHAHSEFAPAWWLGAIITTLAWTAILVRLDEFPRRLIGALPIAALMWPGMAILLIVGLANGKIIRKLKARSNQ